jgi:hypothetical protein
MPSQNCRASLQSDASLALYGWQTWVLMTEPGAGLLVCLAPSHAFPPGAAMQRQVVLRRYSRRKL